MSGSPRQEAHATMLDQEILEANATRRLVLHKMDDTHREISRQRDWLESLGQRLRRLDIRIARLEARRKKRWERLRAEKGAREWPE
ncbi:MAG: hypothetical protein FJX77_03045 [Armatimonadetes bacterium]|nr:hypothetical protein [Armatimonadota bacterium]